MIDSKASVPMQLVSSKVIVLISIEIHCWPRSRGLSLAGSIDAVFGEVQYSPVAICGVLVPRSMRKSLSMSSTET